MTTVLKQRGIIMENHFGVMNVCRKEMKTKKRNGTVPSMNICDRYVIPQGWVFVDMTEAEFIRNNLNRMKSSELCGLLLKLDFV